MVEDIKKIRIELDKHFSTLGKMIPSREISIAITATQNAKMWLGQVLKYIGTDNPYPDSKDAANTKISPTADVFKGDSTVSLEEMEHIQQVKLMRRRLSDSYGDLETLKKHKGISLGGESVDMVVLSIDKSWEYVVEANMWLGMELGRINNQSS